MRLWLIILAYLLPMCLYASINTIVFDFGGVVVVGADPQEQLEFVAHELSIPLDVVWSNWAREIAPLGRGEVSEETFWEQMAAKYGGEVPPDWMERWQGYYRRTNRPNEALLELVVQLQKRGYLTPLLSDTIPSHAAYNKAQGLYDYFQPVVLSHEVGMRKPGPEIYQHLLAKIQRSPEECVFIDDLEVNVAAAQRIGMHGIRYTSVEELVIALQDLIGERVCEETERT